ncbi:hypothetical protein MPCS_01612 (plasmid) [Candidatus Megaera polyxenophila]|nr:hypothetical protein MPCS_01612 [Candidatus Megaera polyxenophila]
MGIIYTYRKLYHIIILIYILFQITICFASSNEVMDLDKFINVLNQDSLLVKYNKIPSVLPLNRHEVLMIEEAKRNEYKSYGGLFDKNRHINQFMGECLFIGGGKLSGNRGENDGITVLINIENELQQIDEVINKLRSGQWEYDKHTGKKFTTNKEKKDYIKQLKLKKVLYKKAFLLKNQDTLDKFYTLNIEPNVKPDILASITNNYDLREIPDHRFDNVEFENVPCSVFLDPNLYPNLERITKIGGKINFSVSSECGRLIIPVIKKTKFASQFIEKLENKLFKNYFDNYTAGSGSYQIEVTND